MYCPKCGAECPDDSEFCPKCGANLKADVDPNSPRIKPEPAHTYPVALTYRDVVTVILLSIVTCGIYTIYWFYTTANELNNSDPSDEPLNNYIIALLLGLVTCGIYTAYWLYLFYKKLDVVTKQDNYVLNFVLSLFLSNLIGVAIGQNAINKVVDAK